MGAFWGSLGDGENLGGENLGGENPGGLSGSSLPGRARPAAGSEVSLASAPRSVREGVTMVTIGCEVKDDEEMIVLIAMARMRVIEVLKPERLTLSQRSRGNWREAKAER